MKTNLEKYLKENRFLLDVDEVDELSVWEGVKAGMQKKRSIIPKWFWKVAVFFLFGIITTYLAINLPGTINKKSISLSDISEELGRQEAEYKTVELQKWQEAQPYISKDKGDYKPLLNELDKIKEVQEIYLHDLNEIGINEHIIKDCLTTTKKG